MEKDIQADVYRDVRLSLRQSSLELSKWKLMKSAKWAAEALQGMGDLGISSDGNYSAISGDLWSGLTEQEFDLYLLASSLFDCKEFDRCAYFLRDVTEPRLMFLKLYCRYLSWDKKSSESSENILMTGKVSNESKDDDPDLDDGDIIHDTLNQITSGVQKSEDGHQSSLAIILNELRSYMSTIKFKENNNSIGLALLFYLKGILLSRQGNKSNAISAYLESLSYSTFNWTCWLELLECISRPDESLLILRHLDESFEIKQDYHIGCQQQIKYNVMIKIFKLALAQEFPGNIDDFFENLEYLLSLMPNFAYLKVQNALVDYNYMDYVNSENQFDQIFKFDPYRLEDLDIYSNILYVMQKHSKLAYLAQFVSQIDRFRPETCCIIANYYSARQEHEKSIMYFRRALILNKRSTSAWTLMGHEFVELKNSHAAIECYRRAVDINDRDYKAWYGLGQAYEVLDMHLYSLYYFQNACTLKPLDRRMWQAVAECYAKMKNSTEAIKCYLRALQLSTNTDQDTLLLFRLAQQYEQILDIDNCKFYMSKCVAIEKANDGLITDEIVKARLWLARHELRMKNYESAYNYAINITNGTSQEIEEARNIARTCRTLIK